jgi:competence protein ComEC
MKDYLSSKNYLISLLKVSILSFFVSIPITLYNFYQINILSIVYNLLFVPLISLIIFPLSMIVGIINPLIPIYQLLTDILEKISLSLNTIKLFTITFSKIHFIYYILYFLIIYIYLQTKKIIILIIVIVLLIIHFIIPYVDSNKYIDILDVDQGDLIVLRINHQTSLIDTGGKKERNITSRIIKPFLKSKGITSIQTLIISHGDYDHMGEAINLVNNFKVEKVIFNCGKFNDLEKELIKVLDKKHIKYYSCIKELNIDNNILYFLQTNEYDNENDNSNVIYTELNGYKFMFMGDAGVDKEKDILEKYNINDIDVLKVGHHGSKTSSSKEFINEINPKYSIISVGKNNRYGHPNKEVLTVLENSKIYRTDQDGSIMFEIKSNKVKIETCSP